MPYSTQCRGFWAIVEDEAFTRGINGKGYIMDVLGINTFNKIFGHNPFVRFKGGGSPDPPSSTMPDTAMKEYARQTLYPMVSAGMEGKGFGPASLTAKRERDLYSGLNKSYETAKVDLKSDINRTVAPQDTRVRNFMSNELNRAFITGKDNIKRGIRAEKVSDIDLSQAYAADYLAGEKRMAIGGAEMYNQALQQNIMDQQKFGTFVLQI